MCDIEQAFKSLTDSMFIRYKGCLISKSGGVFWWAGTRFETEADAKATIDNHFLIWGQSVNRIKDSGLLKSEYKKMEK